MLSMTVQGSIHTLKTTPNESDLDKFSPDVMTRGFLLPSLSDRTPHIIDLK